MNNKINWHSRRQFLRNTTMASVGLGIMPGSNKVHDQKTENLACNPSTLDLYGQGPFYTQNPPTIVNEQLAKPTEVGTRLILSGLVRTLDCSQIIPNTLIDIWHANDAGTYDNDGFNLRGKTYSNSQGFYVFETILPGRYLNGSTFRPRHIHFRITPPGFPMLITQLYFKDDPFIADDAAASVTSGTYNATDRIIPITLNDDGKYEGNWDIIVDGNGTTNTQDIYHDKGIIYSISPNPFTEFVEINYGVYQASKVTIQIFDIKGNLVATLDEQHMEAEKYKAIWKPDFNLPNGIYFTVLKINDLQVHYLKLMKA